MSRPCDFYDGSQYVPASSVGWLLKRVMASLRRAIDERMEQHGLTDAQWGPLLVMHQGRGSTPAEIARELGIDTGSMTRTLDRLEDKGFLQRARCADDRRVVKLELTAEGQRVSKEVPHVIAEVLNLHLQGFTRAEHDQLFGFLERMLANGERLEAASKA